MRLQALQGAEERPLIPELQTINLVCPGVLVLSDVACRQQILCDAGLLWITQDSDPEDHVLRRGDRFTVTHPGRVVILACGT